MKIILLLSIFTILEIFAQFSFNTNKIFMNNLFFYFENKNCILLRVYFFNQKSLIM